MFRRYLCNFDLDSINKMYYDVLIIGTGVAGLYAALNIDPKYRVLLISKNKVEESNTNLAQGGVAAVTDPEDSLEKHIMDTLSAGKFYNNEGAVKILVTEAAENIKNLLGFGVCFDRDKKGDLKVTKEGGHSQRRILHSKDATGKEIIRALFEEATKRENIKVADNIFAIDILTIKDQCIGVLILDGEEKSAVLSKATIFSTGGVGRIYKNTTNSVIATGDGIAMAFRAGAEVADMEFIQFHPTALYDQKEQRKFLISEAVRGEGAILRNSEGEAFMEKHHELKDLAPRDIVSKAIYTEILKSNQSYVYLDITHKDKEFIIKRFPNIYNHCLTEGIDISKEPIPVCPVQHYIMGGIKTDVYGRTNIQGLYACGETACTGVHGANRLASNSLLEGLVFSRRVAGEINKRLPDEKPKSYQLQFHQKYGVINENEIKEITEEIRNIMSRSVSILRIRGELIEARKAIIKILKSLKESHSSTQRFYETVNMAIVSYTIIENALKRKRSLGAHIIKDDLEVDIIA